MSARTFLLTPLVFLALGCGKGTEDGSGEPIPITSVPARPGTVPAAQVDCGKGSSSLSGRFLAPNGTTPVAGAFVYVGSGDCWVGTDKDGNFLAKGVPTNPTQVHAEKGLFQVRSDATPGKALSFKVDASQVKLAYVEGNYDSIQDVLQRLGFQATALTTDQLATTNLAQYAGVFLNCGLSEDMVEDPATQNALRAYVQGGGVLYASDWAESYVQSTFPNHITFYDPALVGANGEQDATVLDEGFKRALGRGTATINFNLPAWAVMNTVAAGTQVLVSGPASDESGTTLGNHPYSVQFQEGKGRVTYTSFHNEAQTTADMNVLLEQLLLGL